MTVSSSRSIFDLSVSFFLLSMILIYDFAFSQNVPGWDKHLEILAGACMDMLGPLWDLLPLLPPLFQSILYLSAK